MKEACWARGCKIHYGDPRNRARPGQRDFVLARPFRSCIFLNLSVFDEKVIPAMVPAYVQFAHKHSKVWSAEIAGYDEYVLVTTNYNGGLPGAIKNAIDYLYNE